jgi:hypothetical protein
MPFTIFLAVHSCKTKQHFSVSLKYKTHYSVNKYIGEAENRKMLHGRIGMYGILRAEHLPSASFIFKISHVPECSKIGKEHKISNVV